MIPDIITKSSETLVFIGAGATAALGMPTTDRQAELFRKLIAANTSISKALLEFGFYADKRRNMLVAFLEFLGGRVNNQLNLVTAKDIANAKIAFDISSASIDNCLLKERILELRHCYDWMALREVLKICPHNEQKDNLVRDVYTLLDKKILSKQGLKFSFKKGSKDEVTVLPYMRLLGARNMLTLLISILFAEAWQKICDGDKSDVFVKYEKFAETFSRMMQKESIDFCHKSSRLEDHSFTLFSTSFVSFNFELAFLWLLYNKNRLRNRECFYIHEANRLNLWLDMGCLHKRRSVSLDPKRHKSGYFGTTFDETSASRLNNCNLPKATVARVGKFLFAHGSSNWRECSACGRMLFYLGDEWKLKSKTLNPPFPIPLYKDFIRTEKEEKWKKELKFDALECPACGAESYSADAPMVMQSLFKGTPTSFIEEIQREVKVALDNARHIVLLGYGLPIDDIVWQQIFSEAVRCRINSEEKAYCSVVVGTKGPHRWLKGEELYKHINAYRSSSQSEEYGITPIENVIAIFGKENVRAYTAGIPDVFGDSTEQDMQNLLYPGDFVNWTGTRLGE